MSHVRNSPPLRPSGRASAGAISNGVRKISCSVGILTRNSAATLARTLDSVRDFDDIIICDGGSADATLDIAREYGARIILQDTRFKDASGAVIDFGGVKNQCLAAAKNDWYLSLDSDETISEGLRDAIQRIAEEGGKELVYRVPIGILIDGRYIEHSSNYPGYQYRFFNKKSGAHFIKPVHERIAFTAMTPIGTLQHPWYIHTTKSDWRNYLKDSAKYRSLEARLYCARSLGEHLRYTVFGNIRTSAAVVLRSAYNYAMYGFSNSMPLSGEMGRALVPLFLMCQILWCAILKPAQTK